jgi:hypothetical protein
MPSVLRSWRVVANNALHTPDTLQRKWLQQVRCVKSMLQLCAANKVRKGAFRNVAFNIPTLHLFTGY